MRPITAIPGRTNWARQPRSERRWILFLIAILISSSAHAQAIPPDPVVLLRGVESTREKIRSGWLEMTLMVSKPRLPKRGNSSTHLIASFEGINRRIDQYQRSLFIDGRTPVASEANEKKLRAMSEDREAFVAAGLGHWKDTHVRSAYDGAQLMQYSEDLGAYVKDPSKGSADYVFDPRTLGITVWYNIDTTVANYLSEDQAKSITLVGPEELDGHRTWHVQIVDQYDQNKHLWIENSEDFKVFKSELIGNYSKLSTTCRYDGSWKKVGMPNWIETREYDGTGTLSEVIKITVDKAEFNRPVDPKQWTLAGLGSPLGKMVIDQRIHRVVGHFDGEGLTPQLPEAIRKGKAARWAPMYWALAVAGLAGLAVVAAVVVHRRNLLRREA